MGSPTDLRQFYDNKYSTELTSNKLKIIKVPKIPSNRFDGVLYYFPKYYKGQNVLEIGGGDGTIAASILNEINIIEYTITDFSDSRIQGLEKKFESKEHVFVKRLNVEEYYPEFESKFDAIVMVALIEHLIDPIKALGYVYKYLKPNGLLYIETPNIAKYTRRIKLLLGQFPSTASQDEGLTTYEKKQVELFDEGHLHYFTFYSLTKLLKRIGFQQIIKAPVFHTNRAIIKPIGHIAAKIWPEMFSDLVLIVTK